MTDDTKTYLFLVSFIIFGTLLLDYTKATHTAQAFIVLGGAGVIIKLVGDIFT